MAIIINNPSGNSGSVSSLPNGALINGVAQITQSALPATRPDGSALVVRDKWYNTASGEEGFWNGTYWVSSQSFKLTSAQQTNLSSSGSARSDVINTVNSILVEKVSAGFLVVGTNDASNYWTISTGLAPVQDNEAIQLLLIDSRNYAANANRRYYLQQPVNQVVAAVVSGVTLQPIRHFLLSWTKFGTPGLLYLNISCDYRIIYS